MSRPGRRTDSGHLLLIVGLLALILWTRAHRALLLPAFVDESLHILRGRVVWQFSDLAESLTPKKLLFYYWIGLFGLDAPASLWIARTATALLALPGAALTYALARRLFDRRAGLLALTLYALAPFLLFFERMALADAFTALIGTALALASLTLARRPTPGRGALAGALLGLALLAKLIALPFAALIPLAILLYAPGARGFSPRVVARPPYRRPLILAALACGLVIAPSFGYILLREFGATSNRVVIEETLYTTGDRAGQIRANTEHVARALLTLLSPALLLALIAALIADRRRPRATLYLLAAALLPWAAVIGIAAALSTRYLVLGLPPLLALIAGRAVLTWDALGARLRWAIPLLLALWAGLFALPFLRTALTDPTHLNLPPRDRWEYFTNTSSGYALRDLAAAAPSLPPDADGRIPLVGFLPACHTLPLYWTAPNAVDLTCPLFGWDSAQQDALRARLIGLAQAHPVLYLAVERLSVFDLGTLPFEWERLAAFPRPDGGVTVTLYRVRLRAAAG